MGYVYKIPLNENTFLAAHCFITFEENNMDIIKLFVIGTVLSELYHITYITMQAKKTSFHTWSWK